MELSNKGLDGSQAELVIEDGVIVKCLLTEGEVTLPDDFKGVARNAFDGCENVSINYPASYIDRKLEKVIARLMRDVEDAFENHEVKYLYPVLRVYDVSPERIEAAIDKAVDAHREKQEWKMVEVDADRIDRFNAKLYAYQGYGILFLKNLNVENSKSLPDNFMYNLIRSHSFNYVDMSRKWLFIIEVGNGVRLHEGGDVGSHFIVKGYYGALKPERFMKEMGWDGKVVDLPLDEAKNTL